MCVCVYPPRHSVSVLLGSVLTRGLPALLITATPLTPIKTRYSPRDDRYCGFISFPKHRPVHFLDVCSAQRNSLGNSERPSLFIGAGRCEWWFATLTLTVIEQSAATARRGHATLDTEEGLHVFFFFPSEKLPWDGKEIAKVRVWHSGSCNYAWLSAWNIQPFVVMRMNNKSATIRTHVPQSDLMLSGFRGSGIKRRERERNI